MALQRSSDGEFHVANLALVGLSFLVNRHDVVAQMVAVSKGPIAMTALKLATWILDFFVDTQYVPV